MPRLPRPARIMSSLKHGAPPRGGPCPGRVAPTRGAAHRVCMLSAAQHPRYNNSTVHAGRGKAGEARPGVHRGAEPECTSLPLRELLDLSWQAAMRPKRYACLLRVGYAPGSPATSGATPILSADD